MKQYSANILCLKLSLLLFIQFCACKNYTLLKRYKEYTYDFFMPHVVPDSANDYHLCMKIEVRDNFYLVGFEPKASKNYIHQMILYGCTVPGSNDTLWNCAGSPIFATTEFDLGDPCMNGSQIVYSWGNDAKGFHLPKDIGFHIGPDSSIQHLVLQVHYLKKYTASKRLMTVDSSGVILTYTKKRMPHLAGVIVLGTKGVIPPHSVERLESTCRMDEENIIHPFAYRIHTHEHGNVVSCYVVRQGDSGDYWSALAKNSPAKPQAFYPVKDKTPIRKGDLLAARCTMNNTSGYNIRIGKLESYESCNFHLMYWVATAPLKKKYCISPGPPVYYWHRALENFRNIPDFLASVL